MIATKISTKREIFNNLQHYKKHGFSLHDPRLDRYKTGISINVKQKKISMHGFKAGPVVYDIFQTL